MNKYTVFGKPGFPSTVVDMADYDALAMRLAEAERDAARWRCLSRLVDTAPARGLYPWANSDDMASAIDVVMASETVSEVQK